MFYIIIRDNRKTAFMQSAGMFEPGKFAGEIVGMAAKTKHTPEKMVEVNLKRSEDYQIIGAVINGRSYIKDPEQNRIISSGSLFMVLSERIKELEDITRV